MQSHAARRPAHLAMVRVLASWAHSLAFRAARQGSRAARRADPPAGVGLANSLAGWLGAGPASRYSTLVCVVVGVVVAAGAVAANQIEG